MHRIMKTFFSYTSLQKMWNSIIEKGPLPLMASKCIMIFSWGQKGRSLKAGLTLLINTVTFHLNVLLTRYFIMCIPSERATYLIFYCVAWLALLSASDHLKNNIKNWWVYDASIGNFNWWQISL